MAEIFELLNIALAEAAPIRRRRVLLGIGDRLVITPNLSISVDRRDGELQQVWVVYGEEYAGPIRQSAPVRCGGVTRIVCRATSATRCLLEVQLDAMALDARLSIVRAA